MSVLIISSNSLNILSTSSNTIFRFFLSKYKYNGLEKNHFVIYRFLSFFSISNFYKPLSIKNLFMINLIVYYFKAAVYLLKEDNPGKLMRKGQIGKTKIIVGLFYKLPVQSYGTSNDK